MTNFDLEHELTTMLKNKSEMMPLAVDGDDHAIGRARTRRRTKLAALGGGGAAAMALVVGLAVTLNDNDKTAIEIQPAESTIESAVTTTPAPETTEAAVTTVPQTTVPRTATALQPGAIVAARDDGVIVELDSTGTELRELYDAGAPVAEIDVDPSGAGLYLRMSSEALCGEVRHVDLATETTEGIGSAAGVAVSGDGQVLALSTGASGTGCGGEVPTVTVRDLDTGFETAFPFERTDVGGNASPDYAVGVALNFDGSRLAFERCWEGCNLLLSDVPLDCIGGEFVCDYQAPEWNEMTSLAHEGIGYGAGAYDPVFQGELLLASECDCDIDASEPNYRLVSFDPQTGERIVLIQDLPGNVESTAVEGNIVLALSYEGALISYTNGEPFTFPGKLSAVTIAPTAEE
jgi:hypothetical protein